MSNAVIVDVETTGFDEPEIVELAYMPITIEAGIVSPGGWTGRFMPSKPISYGAMATHHITTEMLVGCEPSSSARLPEGVEYMVGQNADFDWKALGSPNVKRICTLAMSRKLWPEIDSHSLGAMMYLLEPNAARDMLREAHNALADVIMCQRLLAHILVKIRPLVCEDFADLWKLSEDYRIPERFNFGKHDGERIADTPRDYRQWMLRENAKDGGFDEYVIIAVQRSPGMLI